MCKWRGCDQPAFGSILLPPWGDRERLKWSCRGHAEFYQRESVRRIPGLDPPDNADEYWRPSLFDMIRHALIAEKFEERKYKSDVAIDFVPTNERERRYTPQQRANAMRMRAAMQEYDLR